ncbi:FAD/NAD(P)-binding domain-containing protein [Hypoxylon trugodes]|uniref:FAD/NAD(P)-binding domain-containing protein n=1 Tax=Hypoxylon trugodes TaxID=326681 RepID=UPI0021966BF8|nr:FAD/NAD(P)-binding domain-containing protein [Hypoxylon trugodes]KAI1392737.1 FAD/NAD(P)-binding domain-containing protein [Hypoxylon trugodes]
MAPLNIAIIGAGVGGPAAAIGLARNGHNVTLYERDASIGGIGFAFRITPNSERCLKFMGIDALASGAVVADLVRMMNSKGEVMKEFRENQDPKVAEKGMSLFAYRPAIQKQLIDEAERNGAHIKMGVEVVSVDVSRCAINFTDGSTSIVDLIIGADGVHSRVRPQVIDSSVHFPRASTRHNCLRAVIPIEAIKNDPITSNMVNDELRMAAWRDNKQLIIGYVVDEGRLLNIVCIHPEELSDRQASSGNDGEKTSYNQKISLETARDIYKDFDRVVVRLLELADPGGFRVWKLMDMGDIPRWSAGRVVIIGDACHPVLPFGFSGASMSIEDAATLAVLFPSDISLAQVEDRLQLYEHIRRPRVTKIRDYSRIIPFELKAQAGLKDFRQYLDTYDAVAYAKQELEKYQDSLPS